VGFLRYWNISNLPLFLLAAPMLWILFHSSATAFSGLVGLRPKRESTAGFEYKIFPQLALPQLFLAAMAITSYHVQIINRISSGYPIWYIVIANWLTDGRMSRKQRGIEALCSGAVRWMIVYAIVHAILFAEFLPPA
jgi:phosphatidylinositol glycan class V